LDRHFGKAQTIPDFGQFALGTERSQLGITQVAAAAQAAADKVLESR
jgi:hypothetical protein